MELMMKVHCLMYKQEKVVVPESEIVLTSEQWASLQTLVNPFDDDNEHGKLLYLNACGIINIYVSQN